ncbi:MAG: fumarate reductase/succinate dehydrogenase flavoprotein domain protein [Oscillospiraceae bacterium]|nr:fumarate reductase/succinate dehydrogenase flavoprotein domain protein [Oscillospiraceae bacterium]
MYQITKNCVGCHNCAMECPMGAISYVGLKYEIDPDQCVECGRCEQVCHTCSAIDADAPNTVEQHERIVKECDVVVCGGGSGIVAAVRAAQQGKRVILLEKSKKLGGNTDYAHAFFPVFTNMHKELGLANAEEEAVGVFWERSERRMDQDMIRTAILGCDRFFDWLCTFPGTKKAFQIVPLGGIESCGPMYTSGITAFPNRMFENLLCRDQAIGPGWGGTFVKYKMLEAIRDQKLWVEILTEHRAEHLLTDENGTVTGVLASDPGGEVQINAKAVILATGGMGRSDEKLQKYFGFFDCETPIHRFSVPGDTGDAIDMLQELGVEPDENRMFASIFGPAHHPFSFCLYRILEHPSCLSVNLNGKRWQDETGGLMAGRFEIAKQPKEVAWGIFDQKAVDRIAGEYLNDPALAEQKWIFELYQEDLEEEIALPKAPVKRADSLEKLAEEIGADPAALAETVKRYNEFCANGKDEEFGKAPEHLVPIGNEGPYYAIYGQRFSEGAFGGLRVNPSCEVTREDGSVIPGLYGVGDATSAMHFKGHLAVISELTWAVASAYTSGANAVAYIDSKEGN